MMAGIEDAVFSRAEDIGRIQGMMDQMEGVGKNKNREVLEQNRNRKLEELKQIFANFQRNSMNRSNPVEPASVMLKYFGNLRKKPLETARDDLEEYVKNGDLDQKEAVLIETAIEGYDKGYDEGSDNSVQAARETDEKKKKMAEEAAEAASKEEGSWWNPFS